MATTAKPIDILAAGVQTSSGVAVASGKVRWYLPTTLTPGVVYLDAACASPATAPYTLSAAGTATLYSLEPVRLIVKDSTETTTYYDDIAPLVRHDSVYVTSPGINGGAETTLEAVLADATTSFGSGFLYKPTSTATARAYQTWLKENHVSVKDFAAVGDGSADDTAAIQAAIDFTDLSLGGGRVFLPKGTYKITSGLSTVGNTSIYGVGTYASIIKNASTSATAITSFVSSGENFYENFSITASTTSSGTGLSVGGPATVRKVNVSLHRTGMSISGASLVDDCKVTSTDGDATATAISMTGARARVTNCEVSGGSTTGTGIKLAGTDSTASICYATAYGIGFHTTAARSRFVSCNALSNTTGITLAATSAVSGDCRVSGGTTGISATGSICKIRDCTVASSTTAISIAGTDCSVRDCDVTTATTGITSTQARTIVADCNLSSATTAISLTGANSTALQNTIGGTTTTGVSLGAAGCRANYCTVLAATTGFSVGAFADCGVTNNMDTSTTSITVNASATNLLFHSNNFTGTQTLNNATSTAPHAARCGQQLTTSGGTNQTFTPDISNGKNSQAFVSTNATATGLTIAAHVTSTLLNGDLMYLSIAKAAANNLTVTWNAQYTDVDGSAVSSTTVLATGMNSHIFRWNSTSSTWVMLTGTAGALNI